MQLKGRLATAGFNVSRHVCFGVMHSEESKQVESFTYMAILKNIKLGIDVKLHAIDPRARAHGLINSHQEKMKSTSLL